MMRRFVVVIERAGENDSAYTPDLPGCVATRETRGEVERNMHEALRLHAEGLREDGLPAPESRSFAEYVTVA